MHVIFGLALDGTEWSHERASLGQVRVGPAGMLGILETRLGLGGPHVHPARRIDAYMARIQSVAHERAWFQGSMEADPWSTARQLLAWRDELIEGGWDGRTGSSASERLASLVRVEEATDPKLSPGSADRIRTVLDLLSAGLPTGIARISMEDAPSTLPPVWRAVMDRLASAGVLVEETETHPVGEGDTNLAAIQAGMNAGGEGDIGLAPGDHSLLLLEAHDEWEAAQAVALWLRASSELSDVTLICGSDSGILDGVLASHGLPVVGRSKPSPWRGSLQILPLVVANAWSPLDVGILGELLSLPSGPVPPSAASRLLTALSREPGVGGTEWNKALDDIEEWKAQSIRENGGARHEEQARGFRTRLDERLATRRFPAEPGILEEELDARCQWVIDALQPRIPQDRLAAVAIQHAKELQSLSRGKGRLSRTLVERMLDSILGIGSPSPNRPPEAAPWTVVRSPAEVTRPTGTVLWWDFSERVAAPATWWSGPERKALEAKGVELEPSRLRRRREATGWRRGLLNTREQLLLFHPRSRCGEPTALHPLWDEIRQAAGVRPGSANARQIEDSLRRDCRELIAGGRWELGKRQVEMEQIDAVEGVEPSAKHDIDPEMIRSPGALSFSRMSTMIGCPMSWVLGTTGLMSSPLREIPSGSRMMGNLCHRIVEDLYSGVDLHWTPDEAAEHAGNLYDGLVGSMASELLLDGYALDRQRYRRAVTEAVHELVKAMNTHGLEVEATETMLSVTTVRAEGPPTSPWPTGCDSFRGRADLILRDPSGRRFVLDLKWSGSSRYKREEVEAGEALQLAAYAWMLRASGTEKDQVGAAYFMLAQGELLTPDDPFPRDPSDPVDPLEETWLRGVRSWDARWSALTVDGALEATGINEEGESRSTGVKLEKVQDERREVATTSGRLYLRPPCGFCDFPALCGRVGSDR